MGMGYINCCNGCVPPKRTPTCHSTCKEYIKQKAASDAAREAVNRENRISYEIYTQRSTSVYKAQKRQRRGGKYAK